MGAIEPWHLIVVLVVVLLIFGPKRLPEVGKSLGETIREFRKATTGERKDSVSEAAALPPAPAVVPAPGPVDATRPGAPGPDAGTRA